MMARRRWAGMRSVTVPASRGRLIEAAGPGQGAGAEPRGQAARAGEQGDRISQDQFAGAAAGQLAAGAGAAVAVRAAAAGAAAVLAGAAGGAGAGGEAAGEPVEEVVVGPAGDDRGEGGVAVIAGPGRRPARRRPVRAAGSGPGGGGAAGAGRGGGDAGGGGAVQELVQHQVQLG